MILLLLLLLHAVFPKTTYPILFSTIRGLNLASAKVIQNIGLGSVKSAYNVLSIDGWTSNSGITGPLEFWVHPSKYLSTKKYGSSDKQIQSSLKALYSSKNIQLLVHAFSDNQYPFYAHLDPIQAATNLSNFVINNLFDGASVEILDRGGLSNISNSAWILNFTKTLRSKLPTKIICYQQFPTDFAEGMAFRPIIRQFSSLIDYVVVKYYNFQLPDYSNYSSLFIESSVYPGSSVKDLILSGLLANQIVVGKPSSKSDSYMSNFFVEGLVLQSAFVQGYNDLSWYGGYGSFDYLNDENGSYAGLVTSGILEQCNLSGMCI